MSFDYQAALKSGATKQKILDYLGQSRGFNVDYLKSGGMSEDKIMERLSTKISSPLEAPKEEDLKTKGLLGGMATFFGPEKLGRRIGYTLAGLGNQQKETLEKVKQAEQQGFAAKGTTEQLKTGGVSGKEVLGSALQTGLNVALPIMGKTMYSGKLIAQMVKGGAFGGALSAATQLANEGKITKEKVATGATFGAIVPATVWLGKYIGSRMPKLLSIITGENKEAISEILKNPKVADIALKNGDEALRNAVSNGSEKSVQIRDAFVEGHNKAFKVLAQENSGKLVNPENVADKWVNLLKGNGVKMAQDGSLDFTLSKIKANPGEISKINAAYETMQNWEDWSLAGTNKLKQIIGVLTKFPSESGGMSKSPILGQTYHILDTEIKKNLSSSASQAYSELNQNFSKNIELYNDLINAFNSGDPFTKMAGVLGDNKDSLRQLLKFYEEKTGESVLPVVAGRAAAMERQAAFGFLNPRSWIDFFFSPSAQMKMVSGLGKAQQVVSLPIEKALETQIGNLGTVGENIGQGVRQIYFGKTTK